MSAQVHRVPHGSSVTHVSRRAPRTPPSVPRIKHLEHHVVQRRELVVRKAATARASLGSSGRRCGLNTSLSTRRIVRAPHLTKLHPGLQPPTKRIPHFASFTSALAEPNPPSLRLCIDGKGASESPCMMHLQVRARCWLATKTMLPEPNKSFDSVHKWNVRAAGDGGPRAAPMGRGCIAPPKLQPHAPTTSRPTTMLPCTDATRGCGCGCNNPGPSMAKDAVCRRIRIGGAHTHTQVLVVCFLGGATRSLCSIHTYKVPRSSSRIPNIGIRSLARPSPCDRNGRLNDDIPSDDV